MDVSNHYSISKIIKKKTNIIKKVRSIPFSFLTNIYFHYIIYIYIVALGLGYILVILVFNF